MPKAESHSKADHVGLDTTTGEFVCKHCNGKYRMNVPAPLPIYLAAMNAFIDLHRDCKPQK